MNIHFQSSLGCCAPGPFRGVLHRHERCSLPTSGDLREEPVLDGVELGAIRGVMCDKKPHAQPVGKIHEVLLDNLVGAGVGPTSVAEDDDCPRLGVLASEMLVPHPLDVLAEKPGSVVTCADSHVAGVLGHVIYAMGDNLPFTECGEVVVEGLELAFGQSLARPFENARHLFLLGVRADDGDVDVSGGLAHEGNLFELLIPVLDVLHGEILVERPLAQLEAVKNLFDQITGDVNSSQLQLVHYLLDAEGYPYHTLVLGKPCRVRLDNLPHGTCPFGMLRNFTFAPTALTADTAGRQVWARLKFFDTFSYRMRANSHYFTNFAVSDAVGLQMFGFRPDEVPSVPLVQACHKSQITLRQHIWRCFLYHIMSFGITHKVTKNPPDFQIYLIDIQHIK